MGKRDNKGRDDDAGRPSDRVPFSKVDQETSTYFTEAGQHLSTLEAYEDKQLLADNVLEEAYNKEVEIITDAACSRVIESLIACASIEKICLFTKHCVNGENLGQIVTSGPFGSHVLEKALIALSTAAPGASQSDFDLISDALSAAVEAMCASLYHMASHKYGSFVARRMLTILSGRAVSNTHTKKDGASEPAADAPTHKRKEKTIGGLQVKVGAVHDDSNHTAEAPWPELLESIAEVVLSDDWGDEMSNLVIDSFAGPFLQALLRACGHNKQLQGRLVLAVLGTSEAQLPTLSADVVHNLMTNRQGSHLMEVVFEVAPDDTFQKLATLAFKGRLVSLAQHQTANFAVQAALAALRKPQQLKRMLEDLRPHIGPLLKSRRGGVVAALLAAAGRLQAHEADCAAALWTAAQGGLGGRQGAGPLEAMLCLDTHVTLDGTSSGGRLSPLGCAAIVAVYKYPAEACKQWCEALYDMPVGQLAAIAKDSGGCRVIETYLEGPGAAPKKKRHILKNLSGGWAAYAATYAGSRFVEKCYTMADPAEKETITSELAAAAQRLASTSYGANLMRACYVDAYTSGGADYKKKIASASAAKKEFEALFGDVDQDDEEPPAAALEAEEAEPKKKQDKDKKKKKKKRDDKDKGDEKAKKKKKSSSD